MIIPKHLYVENIFDPELFKTDNLKIKEIIEDVIENKIKTITITRKEITFGNIGSDFYHYCANGKVSCYSSGHFLNISYDINYGDNETINEFIKVRDKMFEPFKNLSAKV